MIRVRVDGPRACVRAGKLLERNDALVRRPGLARTDPLGRGFPGDPRAEAGGFGAFAAGAMDKSAYDARVAERKSAAAKTT